MESLQKIETVVQQHSEDYLPQTFPKTALDTVRSSLLQGQTPAYVQLDVHQYLQILSSKDAFQPATPRLYWLFFLSCNNCHLPLLNYMRFLSSPGTSPACPDISPWQPTTLLCQPLLPGLYPKQIC